MKTYSFLIVKNQVEQIIEINALSKDEAIDIINSQFPDCEGWTWNII